MRFRPVIPSVCFHPLSDGVIITGDETSLSAATKQPKTTLWRADRQHVFEVNVFRVCNTTSKILWKCPELSDNVDSMNEMFLVIDRQAAIIN